MLNNIFPKIHKEGYKFLAISIIITFFCLLFSKTLGLIFVILSIWVYYFFRDPDRFSLNDDNYLVSPADGLITNISSTSGPIELGLENKQFTKVSIFMNVFNCHVNRIPTSGVIDEIIYKPGKFIARRIVCEVSKDQKLKQGDRIGMIRFGSRVDIYFNNKKTLAKLGQNVVAGESLIAG